MNDTLRLQTRLKKSSVIFLSFFRFDILFSALIIVVVLFFHSPMASALGEEIPPRLEELAQNYINVTLRRESPPVSAWSTLTPDEQKLIREKLEQEVRFAELLEAEKIQRDTIVDFTGDAEEQPPAVRNKGLKKTISQLSAIYGAGLQAEKISKPVQKNIIAKYKESLKVLLMRDTLAETRLSPDERLARLGDIFANSYAQTIIYHSKNDEVATKESAAVTLRILTEAYLQAGSQDSTRLGRTKRTLSLMIPLAALTDVAAFVTPYSHNTDVNILAIGGVLFINMMTLISEQRASPTNREDAFLALRPLLRTVDERGSANQLIKAFWAQVDRRLDTIENTLHESAMNDPERDTRAEIPKNQFLERPAMGRFTHRLKTVTDHLVQMTDRPLSSLVTYYQIQGSKLTACKYRIETL